MDQATFTDSFWGAMHIMTIARARRCQGASAFAAAFASALASASAAAFSLAALACVPAAAAPAYLNPTQQAWIALHPRISYAPERDYGPFIFADATGAPQGMSLDFLRLIGSKSGLAFVATPARPLGENLALAERRGVDLLTSLRPTRERAAYLSFSAPYVSVPAALVLADGQPARALRQMNGRRVGVGRGFAVEAYVLEHFPQVDWVALPSDMEALARLRDGTLDGVVADLASIAFIARRQGWPAPATADLIGFEYPLSFAYRSDWPVLGQVLQATLRQIGPEERDAILRRWLPAQSAGQWSRQRRLPLLLGGVLLLLALACALVRYCHPQAGRQW